MTDRKAAVLMVSNTPVSSAAERSTVECRNRRVSCSNQGRESFFNFVYPFWPVFDMFWYFLY